MPRGMRISGLVSSGPLSTSSTETAGSCDSLLASTQPDEPAPTSEFHEYSFEMQEIEYGGDVAADGRALAYIVSADGPLPRSRSRDAGYGRDGWR